MSLSSSLNAGVSGLGANASKLATISDNIANSGTYGYKRADVDFASLVIAEAEGTYVAGGVRVDPYREVEIRGTLVGTLNSTDIAVSGRGLLPVTSVSSIDEPGDPPLMLVSTGSFREDADGYLRNEAGLVLLGIPADSNGDIPNFARDTASALEPVLVTHNQYAASPTTEISVGANLPAIETQAGASGDTLSISVEYYDNTGASQTMQLDFTPTIPATGQSNEWTLEVTDGAQAGAVVAEYTIVFDDTTGLGGSILSVTPVSGTYDGTTGNASFSLLRGPVELAIGTPGSGAQLTQLSSEFAPTSVVKNGAAAGPLSGIEVDQNGYVIASYETGFDRVIYQIPLADVPNLNGLTALDNQAFAVSRDSGPLYLWDAGEGPTGEMLGYSREESNADIAAELTHLIETQRAYSSNARVIQTVDEMLQETTNLKR